jgi:hypothetical protein
MVLACISTHFSSILFHFGLELDLLFLLHCYSTKQYMFMQWHSSPITRRVPNFGTQSSEAVGPE